MTKRIVVAGSGLGGLRSAEAVRARGFTGEVVVVGDELHEPYSRPPLSKGILAGSEEPASATFRRKPSVEDVTWKLGRRVRTVDLDEKQVGLDSAETLSYSALVIATGARARRLEVPGPPPSVEAGRHVLRTLDDAARLRAELRPGVRLIVLGAGFIGCELAATAARLGCRVVCVTNDPEPMYRPLGRMLGHEIRRRHTATGITFRVDVGIHAILGEERVTGALLTDGTAISADLIVEAVGSQCNTEILEGNGLDLSDGVLVDSALRPLRKLRPLEAEASKSHLVPVQGVCVVGDVARFPQPLLGGSPKRIEHWVIPTETGRRAGHVLDAYLRGEDIAVLASQTDWVSAPYFWSEQPPIRIHSLGMPSAGDPNRTTLLEGRLDDDCVVGYFTADSRLIGVIGLGDPRAVNRYRDALGQEQLNGRLLVRA